MNSEKMKSGQIFCEALTMANEARKPIYLIQSAQGKIYLNESGCICHPRANVPGCFVKAIVFPDPEADE